MIMKYSPEQVDRALSTLPEELKEAIFSVETADAIRNACTKQNITDERLGQVAENTGYVLMGLLQPSEFIEVLGKDIGLQKQGGEIARDINRFVFFPVKAALEQLHEIPTQKAVSQPATPELPGTTSQGKAEEAEKRPKKQGSDKYRESTE